ncbi:MAG TPA: sigma-70 family RNA polymerase sigma factor [Candidatus Polarisedimenticolia bacterium]|nr:sigma-70 family RNA polymerase sigma factor [Candidatus Polarisedimenticolia bacterium]
MPPPDEATLIAQAQAGDRAAFETLVRMHDRSVLRLALRLMRTEDEARDIYQESFLKAYRSLGQFRGDASFGTWLQRIVSTVCLDHLRRRAAQPEAVPFEGATRGGREARDASAGTVSSFEPPDDHPDRDPERALARREIRRRIAAALASLPARERMVFVLRHDQGMRLRVIADLLGTTEDTVKNCLFRAHRHLREALGDLGESTPGFVRPAGDPAPAEV